MTSAAPSTPAARWGRRPAAAGPALTRDLLVATLLRLLEQEGLEAVNMRRVGQELGVSPRLLYSHVRDKAAMVDLVCDVITQRCIPDLTGLDWRARLVAVARAMRRALLRYPGAANWILGRATHRLPPTSAYDIRTEVRGALRTAGLAEVAVDHAYLCFSAYTMGHLAQTQAALVGGSPTGALDISQAEIEESFETGLAMVIAGVEHMASRDEPPRNR